MTRLLRLTGPVVMFAVCVALGYVVQAELGRDSGTTPVLSGTVSPGKAAPALKLAVPSAMPISAYSETLTRPLFHTSRKPAPNVPEATPEAPAVDQPALKLVGVIIVPEARSALIRLPRTKELVEVLIGERIEGWRLETIESDRIVLKSGKASAVYQIDAELR